MDEKIQFLGCAPLNFEELCGVPYTPHKGSIIANCSLCKTEVWLGPRQQIMRSAHNWQIVCFVCAIKSGIADPNNIKTLGGK